MPRFADHLTGIADVLATDVQSGEVRVNLGDAFDGKGIAAGAPMWGQYGFASRPADPTTADTVTAPAGACMAIYYVDGNQKRVLLTRDNRFIENIGDLQPGGAVQFNDTGSFHQIQGGSGLQILYVPFDRDSNGVAQKAHSISMDPASGNEHIAIVHAKGHCLILNQDGNALLKSANGEHCIGVDDNGIVMSGLMQLLGGIAAGDTSLAQPVMLATTLLAWIVQVQTALVAIAAASGLPTNPTVVAPTTVPTAADSSQTLKASPI